MKEKNKNKNKSLIRLIKNEKIFENNKEEIDNKKNKGYTNKINSNNKKFQRKCKGFINNEIK